VSKRKTTERTAECLGGPLDGCFLTCEKAQEWMIYSLATVESVAPSRTLRYVLLQRETGWVFRFVGYGT
jgi:hypothetical protein